MEGKEQSVNTDVDRRDISDSEKKRKKRQGLQGNSMGDNSRENLADKKLKRQGKVTDLYLVISETVSESSDVKSYIRHRIGDRSNVDFDIINISMKNIDDQPKCIITVRFKSSKNASEAMRLLHASNRESSSRIHCFFDKLEAEGDKSTNMKKRMKQLEMALVEVVETANSTVEKHENKITEVCKKVEDAELKIRKGISLLEFNQLKSERDALLDKKTELDRQRSEFSKYIKSMKTKLSEIVSHEKFENELKEIRKSFGVECQRLSTALPMYARREDILTCVSSNQVSVILGETGSGKSTQMVQYLYQAGFAANGVIACTQPRKIAAVSLATHVASELASSVGQVVGYKVGMQSKTSGATKVIFMTDHILLNECLSDKSLAKYSCVIIDEAHERSIHTDLLLGMLKECLNARPNLKVIITSATIDPDVFVRYFGGKQKCPVLQVSGRTFPVEVYWEEEGNESSFPDDYETKALKKAQELHKTTKTEDGDILVFLTSPVETDKCVEKLKASVKEDNILCLPLHGRLKPEEQQLVFATTPVGKRKIVFATNSAETSITIPGIKFVIDTGVVKEMRYDPRKNMNALSVVAVSQSSANQRKGRAGRTASGVCYRLYSEKDYKEMDASSNPEILRVQVSQALLKLMELGVDPLHFDYVQSPSVEAMKIAYNELKSIGVATENGLSELGRWVARMPVEPKLGVFIKKGIDLDITLETLIVASSCTQTGIFFRAGSLEEKKMADMKKVKFCHNGGDLLTMLNVYREWDAAKEKEKGKWCMENSINGKAMKGIRDTVNEISFILKKEFDMKVKHEFKLPEEVDLSLHSLIIRCMRDDLACYLGHDSAGYLIIERMQMVQIHPSSSVLSLGKRSPWVVFGKVLQTSADYITEVTPLSEDDVMSIVRESQISINISALETYKVSQTLLVKVGDHVFWKLVGPMHAFRRRLEDEIRVVCNAKSVFIDANKKNGELRLFCNKECERTANHLFLKAIKDVSNSLLIESREEPLGKDKTVRAILREGGAVSDILMPDEYRALNIKQKEASDKITEEGIRKCLEIPGEIEQIYMMNKLKNNQSPYCGKVTFVRATDARKCATMVREDVNGILELHPLLPESKPQTTENHYGYTIRLTWCRRPSKGHAYVYLNRPEDKSRLLMSSLHIKGSMASIVSSKRDSDLTIKGLPKDVLEEQVKEALASRLGISPCNIKDRFRIIIPRVNSPVVQNERHNMQQQLVRRISEYVSQDSYSVNVKEFKPQTVTCVAFVAFSDLQIFLDAGNALMNNTLYISGNPLKVSLESKASISIRKQLYHIIKDDIDHFAKVFSDEIPGTSIDTQQLKTGHFRLNIKCSTPEKLAKVKVAADGIVGGDYLDEADHLRILFSRNGRQLAKDIGEKTKTLIFIDDRQQKVNIQGLAENRKKAIDTIDKLVSKHTSLTEETLCLKDHPGLLRNLFVRYGADFSKLKSETEIFSVTVNLRSHDLTISGEAENVAKAIGAIKTAQCGQKLQTLEEGIGDCPICFCQVEHSCMSRLEYCGHAYCKPCLDSLIQVAITDRQFPIVCAKEGCDKPLVMRDLNRLIKNGTVKVTNLVDGAVANFVSRNKSKYHFCSAPDCGLVYRVSELAAMHMCPACRTQICSACHAPYHVGLTCEMYKSAKGDGGILLWLKANPSDRKRCPKCGIGIEKIDGCHHMTCTCGAHVCWMCLEYFETSRECYGHMQSSHGTFV